MKKLKMKLLGFTKDTLDSYNKTIINSITENISVKTRAKSNNLEPHDHLTVIVDKNECLKKKLAQSYSACWLYA